MDGFADLAELLGKDQVVTESMPQTRELCPDCRRPTKFCWCTFLPETPIKLRHSRVLILMHPHEPSRSLHTVPLLQRCLEPGKCDVLIGRKFHKRNDPEVHAAVADPENLLLFPSADAIDLHDIPPRTDGQPRTLIALDGTWTYAKNMFDDDKHLFSKLTKVKLMDMPPSEYKIRRQPQKGYLCTLEAVALSLGILEENDTIFETCLRPLRAIVRMQQASEAATLRDGLGPWHTLRKKVETFNDDDDDDS